MDGSCECTQYYNENIMSHFSIDDTLINASIPRSLDFSRATSYKNSRRSEAHSRRRSIHSEPTVELNHPIESGILTKVEDYLEHSSETEEIIFPYDSDPTIELDNPGSRFSW